jgi:hypothetical protein
MRSSKLVYEKVVTLKNLHVEINYYAPLKEYCSKLIVDELCIVEELLWSNHHCRSNVSGRLMSKN